MSGDNLVAAYWYLRPQKDNPGISLQENVADFRSKSIFRQGRNRFSAYDSPAHFYNIWASMDKTNRNFYEVIQDVPRKLYFHLKIDNSSRMLSMEYAEYVKDMLIFKIDAFFQELFTTQYNQIAFGLRQFDVSKDIILCTSHGVDMYQYDIVVDNISFPSAAHCKECSMKIIDTLPEEMKHYFNLNVNQVNKQVALPGTYDKGIFKQLHINWVYFGNPIIWEPRCLVNSAYYQNNKDYFFFEKILISYFPGGYEPTSIMFNLPSTSMFEDAIKIGRINQNDLLPLVPEGWIMKGVEGNYVPLKRVAPVECLVCKKIHDYGSQYLVITSNRQDVFFKCLVPKMTNISTGIKLGSIQPDYNFVRDSNAQSYSVVTPDYRYCEPHVRTFEPIPWNIFLIWSYLGTGKTTAFINIARRFNFNRILILGSRRKYVSAIVSEFNSDKPHLLPKVGEDFQSYMDIQNFNVCNRLAIQMESLYKLKSVEQPFDLLVIDESEAVLNQFSSTATMKHNIDCSDVFERLIRTTPYIIGGDAFLSTKSVRVLKEINRNTFVIKNEFPPPPRKCFVYPKWEQLVFQAFEVIRSGKKIVFVCGSKEKANAVFEHCVNEGISCKKYTSESTNPKQDIKDLANVNEAWKDIQCLIYTSTITVGVNFDTPGVFHQLFVFGTSRGSSVRDVIQGTLRVRHLVDNVMHLNVNSGPLKYGVPITEDEVATQININSGFLLQLLEYEQHRKLPNIDFIDPSNKDHEIIIYKQWKFCRLWLQICNIANITESNLSKYNYWNFFRYFLDICGYTVYRIQSTEELKLISPDSTYKYEDVDDIDDKYYEVLDRRIQAGIATLSDHQSIEKYKSKNMTSESLPYQVRADLFNYHFGSGKPERKAHFYNLYTEKFSTVLQLMENQIPNRYVEFATNKIAMLNVIQGLNILFGMNNSSGSAEIYEEYYYPLIGSQLDIFLRSALLCGCTTTAEDPILQRSKLIQQIYTRWCGAKVKRTRDRKMTKGDRVSNHILSIEGDVKLWEALTKWDNTSSKRNTKIIEPYQHLALASLFRN